MFVEDYVINGRGHGERRRWSPDGRIDGATVRYVASRSRARGNSLYRSPGNQLIAVTF